MKVALVHDYLREYGGAERVLETLHEIFPEAPIFTAYFNPSGLGSHAKEINKWNIKTSWLQNIPFANFLVSPFRIFAPSIFESFDLKEFDVVISSCNIYYSKAVIVKPSSLHISYLHTPPRYLYGYTTSFNYKKNIFTKIIGELMNHFLRIYDYKTSQRPDILVANSQNVQKRIAKFYRRDSVVIYPPVDLNVIASNNKTISDSHSGKSMQPESIDSTSQVPLNDRRYFLSLSRLVRGKGVEIIVKACTKLNLPLKVVGSGPELENLKKIAGKNVEFIGEVEDEELPEIYANAKALIVSSEDEDFGITSVEAQSAGTPVIAVRAGGYLETIIAGKTGEFFDKAEVEDLIKVLKNFNPKKYKEENLQKNAQRFSKENFKKQILDLVDKNLKQIY